MGLTVQTMCIILRVSGSQILTEPSRDSDNDEIITSGGWARVNTVPLVEPIDGIFAIFCTVQAELILIYKSTCYEF